MRNGRQEEAAMMGIEVLRDSLANKGTAFTLEERKRLELTGLLPARAETIDEQFARVLANLRAKPSPIEKFVYLAALRDDNETLFFRALIDHLEELLPLVYTPTVGQACSEWSRIWRRPRGLYVTAREHGRVREVLRRWPARKIAVIVVTDGGRVLGLGDLGANGMGIPIGKLALYTACAGVDPALCLPVMLDVGTDTESVRDDPFYLGLRQPRLVPAHYDALIEEFVAAAQEIFPGVLLQFEDFANVNAFRLLARYRDRICAFNDDIQGTAAMALAGLRAAQHLTGRRLAEERLLFFGAGAANTGIATLAVAAMMQAGLTQAEARARCWFMDSRGLVVEGRAGLAAHKQPFAQVHAPIPDLLAAVEAIRPTALIGASGAAGAFTEPVLAAMAADNRRPVIFALSNPTSKAECTAEQAYAATRGRAIFASGSPFAPVTVEGRSRATGQANNSFIFPGLGLGVLAAGATRVTDAMFLAAADALAGQVSADDLDAGRVFPPAARMREVAAAVATAVARVAHDRGLATRPQPPDLGAAIRESMYRADYAAAG
ncbi:MAG TPA: NAD-dependent malic enzyme [Burkholderiales bacterium]|nr:NAD-dependent malic enzyme [Burkholderiales bacterium]